MSDSRTIAESWLLALATNDTAAATKAVAPEVALHGVGAPVRGRSSLAFVLSSFRAAFPDLRLETEVLAAEGPLVIVRFTATGTQQGALFGLRPGETRTLAGISCVSVGAQGITDVWLYVDAGQLVADLGLRPAQPGAADADSDDQSGSSWLDQFTSSAREIWLAGVGALGAAGEQGERLFHTLVERGRTLEATGRARMSGTAESVETKARAVAERARAAAEQARSVASSGQEYISDVTSGVRDRLEAPTRSEFEELNRKIERLAARLESTSGAPIDPVNRSPEDPTSR